MKNKHHNISNNYQLHCYNYWLHNRKCKMGNTTALWWWQSGLKVCRYTPVLRTGTSEKSL